MQKSRKGILCMYWQLLASSTLWISLMMSLGSMALIFPKKRMQPGDQGVQNHAKTSHIDFWTIVFYVLEELWGCVGRTATKRVESTPKCKLIAESKIHSLMFICASNNRFSTFRSWWATCF
ncbi:hypothetical protein H1C71_035816 [Ictidomys tridecemlineatus]|nr:hypothetical protein H1C71_035816 [Ictidomys tridecemlineatus]